MSSPSASYEVPVEWGLVIGTSIGMIVFLYVTRYVCNILVIDICILGDWGAYKKIFWCCCKRQLLEEQEERRRRSRFENIGASNDPVGVLYDSVLCSEESRKTFLQLITDTEVSIDQQSGREIKFVIQVNFSSHKRC